MGPLQMKRYKEMMNENEFSVKVEKYRDENQAEGTWNQSLVEIFHHDEKIGEYVRNYPSFGEKTFCPFQYNGKWYALYSKNYSQTHLMSLPDCKDICFDNSGFCPTDFYIPKFKQEIYKTEDNNITINYFDTDRHYDHSKSSEPWQYCDFGFIAGCYWGDDSSWKIQFIDLSRIGENVFTIDDRFGYIELPNNLSLREAIDMDGWEPGYSFRITTQSWYNIKGENL